MKHAPVQAVIAGIVILGAQAAVRADVVEDVAGPGRAVVSASESIDADAVISVTPGEDVGVFVQYASGGHWNVFTSCDTHRSDRPCRFDLIISANASMSLAGPEGHQLEPVDVLSLGSDGTIHLRTGTAGKLDGVTFDTDPGATIELDVILDGSPQPDIVQWIDDSRPRRGTSDNPVDFTPASP